MTAIAIVYVVPGFVIAADGRRRWADQGSVNEAMKLEESEEQQKIFIAQFEGRDVAYALTGLVFNEDKTFDLIVESRQAAMSLATAAISSVDDYVDSFSNSLRNAYNAARQDGRIKHFGANSFCSDPEERDTVARIFMAGYFCKGEPSLAVVTLSQKLQTVLEPKRIVQSPPQNPILSGSAIAELMYGRNDPRFAQYVRPISRSGTLEEAKEYARSYIEACCDPIAAEIDPACGGIGGRIHMATLTSQQGFSWVSGFEASVNL